MNLHKKEINGLKMKAYKDSGASWCIESKDKDGHIRIEFYNAKRFSLSNAFSFHAELWSNF